MFNLSLTLIIVFGCAALFGALVLLSMLYRKVVPTNRVHIVQSRAATRPYGANQGSKNVYYKWPSWVPFFGISVIELPISNFDLSLKGYEAYDKDRVPFNVDVTAFFRIKDTARAAERISSLEELIEQLTQIVQGAVRKVLSSDVIDNIMLERASFGKQFTGEIEEQLLEWGVEAVKSLELMDIRDSNGSHVISNIMAKKTSHIEMESRTEVAKNKQLSETAEIESQRRIQMSVQEAEQQVGERTANTQLAVGIAQQKANQGVMEQQKETQERSMAVTRVAEVRKAEIEKEKQVILAEQTKQTTVVIASGNLEAAKANAQAVEVSGKAKAEAEKAMQMAPVDAQIALAKEIGTNEGYQQYLATLEGLKAYIAVGSKQAEALAKADVKVISNSGTPTEGASKVMDLFSGKGGQGLAGMVETFANTPIGAGLLKRFGVNPVNSPEK